MCIRFDMLHALVQHTPAVFLQAFLSGQPANGHASHTLRRAMMIRIKLWALS